MKKTLLFFAALAFSGILQAQTGDCTDLFMSEYVEGWNNNKAVELYNPTAAPIVLDNVYRIIRWSNGLTNSDQDIQYVVYPMGTIQAYSTFVIIQDTIPAGQDTMVWPGLRKHADWLAPYAYGTTPPTPGGNCIFWNGDDAVSLQKKQTNNTWKDIDIFGEIGVRPTNWQGTYTPSGAWTDTKPYILGVGRYLTKSKTLVRKPNIKHGVDRNVMIHYGDSTTGGIPNSFFALLEFDSLPANTFDSLGFHRCDCKSGNQVLDLGPDQSIVVGDTVTLDAGDFLTYAWSTGETTRIVKIDSSGVGYGTKKVYCQVTDAHGQQSDTIWITFKPHVGINDKFPGINFNIQPNPVVNNKLTVTGTQDITSIEMFSVIGEKVYSKYFDIRQKEVNVMLNGIHNGIYLVRISYGNHQSVIKKIIIQ